MYPKTIFYLLKGDYNPRIFKVGAVGSLDAGSLCLHTFSRNVRSRAGWLQSARDFIPVRWLKSQLGEVKNELQECPCTQIS